MNDSATIVLAVHCITHYYGFDGSRVQTIKKTNVANIIVYIYINTRKLAPAMTSLLLATNSVSTHSARHIELSAARKYKTFTGSPEEPDRKSQAST